MSQRKEENVTGAVVQLRVSKAGVYEARQVSNDADRPPTDGKGLVKIDWMFGPTKVSGFLNRDDFELDTVVGVNGISLGNVRGNLKDGVRVLVDLFTAKGELRFYLKNGNEVWIGNEIKITFNGRYEGDYKIVSF